MLDTMRAAARGVEHGGMMFVVCDAVRCARADLKPVLSRKCAFPAQNCFQICSGTPHGSTDSKHHSTMLDAMRGRARGVEHG
eukprot:5955592-Lingulodinium_polyedra.AAC.1